MPPVKPSSSSFLVLAAKPGGGRRVDVRKARDRRHLAEQLKREKLVALKTWPIPSWASSPDKVGLKDQAELHQQLAQLLTRGVPLVEALEVTASVVSKGTRSRVERMRELVAAGASFSDACDQVAVFDKVTVAVYRAAERTGDLGGAAKQLSATARRQLAISGRVVTLLIYPIIVLTIGMIMTTFMLTFIVPKIGKAITEQGLKLPSYTQVMVAVGEFIGDNALYCALGVAIVLVALFIVRAQLIKLGNRVLRGLPLFKDVVLAQETARFFTVMAAMTRSGIVLADALAVASNAIGHPLLKRQLITLRNRLVEGGILRQLIDNVDALPIPTRRLLIAAERAGDLESAFETLALDSAEELDRRSSRLMAALEPLLIVILFLVIGSLLLSIMVPLLKLSGQQLG
ncbi:MAG: type II secretion system F family protein [Phycisphaerales bacterium]